MTEFIPGLKLSELFYLEAVSPILDAHFAGLAHTAALIGYGSDVIGFDTRQSTDHAWGPRLVLFLPETEMDCSQFGSSNAGIFRDLDECLRNNLPVTFHGYPTNFGSPDEIGVRLMHPVESGPVDHNVEITSLRTYLTGYLGVDPCHTLSVIDWLAIPTHRLLAVTSGGVFHDDLGLASIRERLSYYPENVWLYLMAAEWAKIDQEEPFMGRTGDVGDEIGSRIIAARLVQYLMHVCFLIERRYAPYSKWFGSGFKRLECAARLGPIFSHVLAAETWQARQESLSQAYQLVAEMHNRLQVTPALETHVSPFHDRPYLVIHSGLFADALLAAVKDPVVRALPARVGSINQFVDSTDVSDNLHHCRRLRAVYME